MERQNKGDMELVCWWESIVGAVNNRVKVDLQSKQ